MRKTPSRWVEDQRDGFLCERVSRSSRVSYVTQPRRAALLRGLVNKCLLSPRGRIHVR